MTNMPFNQAAEPESFIPTVVEQTKSGERGYDLLSRLMKDNIVMVQGPINAGMASIIVGQLLFLGTQLADQPADKKVITMNIDSPGGSVHAGMSIYDTMNFVQSEYGVAIRTVGLGMNMSMGSFLLCAGTPGQRFILPNADHMVHQPSGGTQGTATSMKIDDHHMKELHQRLTLLYTVHTKMSYDEVQKLANHGDTYLRAEECVKLGLVDDILYADKVKDTVEYAPGVKEHLERISKLHRELNKGAQEGRITSQEEMGPHTALVKRLLENGPSAAP